MKRTTVFIVASVLMVVPFVTHAETVLKLTNVGISGRAYFWRTGFLRTVEIGTGKQVSKTSFPYTGTVKSVAYDDTTGAVAYVTTAKNVDSVKLRYLGSEYYTTLKKVRHDYSEQDAPKNARATAVHLLRDHKSVTFDEAGWEGGTTFVYDRLTKKQVASADYKELYDSPNGKLFVRANIAGMGSGNVLKYASSAKDSAFKNVDWTKVHGDTSGIYDPTTKEIIAGFSSPMFIDDHSAYVIIYTNDYATLTLTKVNFKTLTLTKVATLTLSFNNADKVGNNIVFSSTAGNKATFTTLNLTSKKYKTLMLTKTSTDARLETLAVIGNVMLVRIASDYDDIGMSTKNVIYAVDIVNRTYHILTNYGNPWLFAGVPTK